MNIKECMIYLTTLGIKFNKKIKTNKLCIVDKRNE